ncbi:MAG: PadR family transcriptional regulator [Acidimicrobiales bacterium]
MIEEREPARRRSPGSLRTAVLAALVEQPAHGYDLTTRLNRRMGPALQVDARRVYEVLEQLERDGLAASAAEHTRSAPHRPRRVFNATELGRETHAGWIRERQPPPLVRADIHALVAFSTPDHARQLLGTLEEYELDCIELQESAVEIEVPNGSWRSRMINLARAALAEQLQAELRWITRVRREIEEYSLRVR